jgi:hypothetical protein
MTSLRNRRLVANAVSLLHPCELPALHVIDAGVFEVIIDQFWGKEERLC